MRCSTRIALCTSMLVASVVTSVAWLSVHPVANSETPVTPRSTASRRFDPLAKEGGPPIASCADTRHAVKVQVMPGGEAGSERAPPLSPRVRVRGQVRRGGRPVADFDLSFESVGLRPDEDDWDSTDEDGRYAVEVRADRYVVINDVSSRWLTHVTVPAGERELVVDIDLPPGESTARD